MSAGEQIGGMCTEFIDVVCADAELLRAEFDAIIDAAWAGTPPEDPAPEAVAAGGPPPRHGAPRFPTPWPGSTRPVAVQEERSRQRSPPGGSLG